MFKKLKGRRAAAKQKAVSMAKNYLIENKDQISCVVKKGLHVVYRQSKHDSKQHYARKPPDYIFVDHLNCQLIVFP